MNRARSFTAIVAIFAAVLIPPIQASAQTTCDSVDGLFPGLGGTLGSLQTGVEPVDGLCGSADPSPEPTPTTQPTTTAEPTSTTNTEPTSGPSQATVPGVPVAQPSVAPREAASGAPVLPGPARVGDALSLDEESPVLVPIRPAAVPVGTTVATISLGMLVAAGLGIMVGRANARSSSTRVADARLEAVLDLLPDGVLVADTRGRVRAINGALGALVPSPKNVHGRWVWSTFVGDAADGSALSSWIRARGDGADATTANLGPDRIPVAISTAPIARGAGSVFVVRDLRPQQALERMKREFLSNVGHELRTPLTSALGFARMLRERELNTTQRQTFLDAIVNACERLDRVVDLVVDLTTMQAGGFQFYREPLDIGELVGSCVERWREQAPDHVFAARVSSRLPHLTANATLVRHLVDELLDNAVKFSPSGGIVSIELRGRRSGDERAIELTVADQGIGIDHERMEELFREFHQLDASETRAFGGLGLGLAFVHRVAQDLGGSVDVTSEPGKGSAFTVQLPAEARVEMVDVRDPRPRATARATGRRAAVKAPART